MSRALAKSDPAESATSILQAMLEDLIERAHVLLDYVTGDADLDAEDDGNDEPDLGWTLNGAMGTTDDLELVNEDGINEDGCDMGGSDNGIGDHGGLQEQASQHVPYLASETDRAAVRLTRAAAAVIASRRGRVMAPYHTECVIEHEGERYRLLPLLRP